MRPSNILSALQKKEPISPEKHGHVLPLAGRLKLQNPKPIIIKNLNLKSEIFVVQN